MKPSEIREKSRDQLKEELIKKREELMNMRFKQANLALEGTADFKKLKKDIARIKTIMHEQIMATKATAAAS